jgi:EmrB/QacA subfamily drug resistance transporter
VVADKLDRGLLRLTGILVVGALGPVLDTTIVNVGVDALGRGLHAPVSTVQWAITGYLLALGMAVPLTGWLADRYGARRIWLAALGLFLAGSVLSGAAWGAGALVAFRVVQGAGAGLMLPIMQTLLVRASGGRDLGRLMATVSAPALVGPILGPVLGGLVIGNLSWRWMFYVNVPICLVAIVLAWRHLPDTPRRPGRRPDVLGLALLSPGVAAMIYGLSRLAVAGGAGRAGLGGVAAPEVWIPVVAGAVLLAAFAAHALRAPEPAIDLRLFRVRSFAAAGTLLFLSGLSMFGAMLLLPLYYQQVRGAGVITAGLLLAPQGLGSLATRGPVGRLTDRIGARPVVLAGLALTVLGTVGYALAGPHTSLLLLAGALVVRGAGLSAANLAVMAAAYQGLARDDVPHASSATRILQQIGGAFGTAVLAVILARQAAAHPVAVAFDNTFWWSLAFTAVAVVPALFLLGARTPPAAVARGGAEKSMRA